MERKVIRARNGSNKLIISSKNEEISGSSLSTYENQDANQLSVIFPEEVWLMILREYIGNKSQTGTDHLTNFSLASPYFKKVLDGQRTYFLFPKVLKTLSTWLEDQEAKIGTNYGDTARNTEKPVSFPIYKLTDILICREVCRGWNKGFKDLYQNLNRYTQMQHDDKDKCSRKLCEIKIHYEQEQDETVAILNPHRQPSSFLDHFKRTHEEPPNKGNPFPGRSINFGNVQLEDFGLLSPEQEVFDQGLSQILAIYGQNLWHCDMKVSDLCFTNRINIYLKLKTLLTHMPNLRTLKLDCYHIFESEQIWTIDEILDGMQADVSRNPLPEMKNLQFLQVQNLAPVIFNELVRTSAQSLTQLDIKRRQEAYSAIDYDIYSETNPLIKLKELSLDFCSEEHFKRMENSKAAANWKLEKFYFLYEENARFLDWSRVFHMIGKNWSTTITNLVLQMPVAETDADKNRYLKISLSRTVLQFLNLKRIKLIVKDPCSLDFLLASRNSLECMEIIADYNADLEKGKRYYQVLQQRQCVEFLGYEANQQMLMSNILENFPKLNFLKIVTTLNSEESDGKYYGICVYEAGSIKSEDRLEYDSNLMA